MEYNNNCQIFLTGNDRKGKGRMNRMGKGDIMEDMNVFKSYLRRLLQDLKDLKEVIRSRKLDQAEEMIDRLIGDTQKGIED